MSQPRRLLQGEVLLASASCKAQVGRQDLKLGTAAPEALEPSLGLMRAFLGI